MTAATRDLTIAEVRLTPILVGEAEEPSHPESRPPPENPPTPCGGLEALPRGGVEGARPLGTGRVKAAGAGNPDGRARQ